MNIIIAGDGKVGSTLTRQLCAEGHDITLIDSNAEVLSASVDRFDVISVQGNCASMAVLEQAGVRNAELLIAATSKDEVNLLCCTTAHAINPKLHTIARVRNPEYTEQIYNMRDVFGLSMLINPENQAATEIERLLKYPAFLHQDTFAKGRTEIVELRVDSGSKLCNVRLADLRSLVRCQVLVCAVLRDGAACAPGGDFVLREGDRVFVTALSQNLTMLLRKLGLVSDKNRSVILCGGGRVSYYLARKLCKSGVRTKIIDNDPERCRELSELLPDTEIVCGNASDLDVLEDEGLADCSALVTLTGLDELNMIVSMVGVTRGVPQVVTKLGHLDDRGIPQNLPLGSVVCPKELCGTTITRYVRAMQNQTGTALSRHAIADEQVEAMEFAVDEKTRFRDTPLKQLRLKPNILVVSVAHGAQTEIANGDTCFRDGDIVVVVTNGHIDINHLNDIFA